MFCDPATELGYLGAAAMARGTVTPLLPRRLKQADVAIARVAIKDGRDSEVSSRLIRNKASGRLRGNLVRAP